MSNPQIPVVASGPAFPPVSQLPWGYIKDGKVWLEIPSLQLLQYLYAAIQGQGGIIDVNVLEAPSAGVDLALAGGQAQAQAALAGLLAAAPGRDQAVAVGQASALAAKSALAEGSAALGRDAALVALLSRPAFDPIHFRETSPSVVTWTPTVAGSATPGAQTYGVQVGLLAYIGPVVLASFSVALTALDGATAGDVTIAGLPVPASTTGGRQAGWVSSFANVTQGAGYTQIGAEIAAGASAFALEESGSALAALALPAAGLSATSAFVGGAIFFR